jgi:hypothetical protein
MIDPVRSNPLSSIAAQARRFDRAAEQVSAQAAALSADAPPANAGAAAAGAGGAAGIAGAMVQMDTARLAMLATLKMAMKSNEAVASLLSSYGREG